jgi:hypothetical protein
VRIESGSAVLTFKGEMVEDQAVSSRVERHIPVPVADVSDLIDLFEAIGYPLLFRWPKTREPWRRGDVVASLDEWPLVGTVIEIEAPAADLVKRCVEELGLPLVFDNHRLAALLKAACADRGLTFDDAVRKYEETTGQPLGRLEVVLGDDC